MSYKIPKLELMKGKEMKGYLIGSHISDIHRGKHRRRYILTHHCGREKLVLADTFLNHNVKCDCERAMLGIRRDRKGNPETSFANRWNAMLNRCYKKQVEKYPRYGGRGIKVCKRWHTFKNFYEDMYPSFKMNLSLERIDNDKDYCPENCRWATATEQAKNRSSNLWVEHNGERMVLLDWANRLNISYDTLKTRYHRGYRGNELFNTREIRWGYKDVKKQTP